MKLNFVTSAPVLILVILTYTLKSLILFNYIL
ncbi:hypothetical protein E2R56_11130 [Rhodococcus qingshengii]|nr:hypothetical protein E2R56_11130 [Rhodococcus qingshengii]